MPQLNLLISYRETECRPQLCMFRPSFGSSFWSNYSEHMYLIVKKCETIAILL
jgi:hypothetical protein